jgi:L-rhamnose mutarotase
LAEDAPHRTCRVLKVLAGKEAEYDRRHHAIWPELAEEIRDVYTSFTVFRSGRLVVVYGDERERVEDVSEIGARWIEYMADVLEPGVLELDEVMHLS